MQKEGLQSALDFTKYLLALASGAIAFVIQPTFYGTNLFFKWVATIDVILLGICVISGILILSRGAVMLAQGNFNLEDSLIKLPGLINIFSFGLGFLVLGMTVALKLWQ